MTTQYTENQLAFCNLSPDTMLDAIESAGFACDGRFLTLNSYENRVFQISLEDDTKLVAKFYRPERWSNEAILEEHAFTQELSKQDIPVISPVTNQTGNTLLFYDDFRFAVYPCHGGHTPELDNPKTLEQLGRFLGRLHATGKQKTFQHRRSLSVASMLDQPSSFLLEHQFIPMHLEAAYAKIIEDLKSRIDPVFETNHYSALRLHGDFHRGNILWTDSGPHIVDFDDTLTGPAIQDIWMLLSGSPDDQAGALQKILEGYEQFERFDARELVLIEPLRTLRMIYYAYWLASRYHDPAFVQAFPWFNTDRYWEEHVLELKEQLALLDEPPLSLI